MKKILFLFAIFFLGLAYLTSCKEETPSEPDLPGEPPVEDNKVTLYFETYGGEEISPITKIEPGSIVELPIPTREGYSFDYWYTTKDLEFGTDLRKTLKVNETMTVYAGWFALYHDITFVTNCGVKLNNLSAFTDEVITLPVLERENYEFLGWYENDELYTRTTMQPRNFTLTAKWARLAHNVHLNAEGGTIDTHYQNQKIEHHQTAILPTPEKTGFTFVGWYHNDELITEQTEIISDLELTAKYEDTKKYSQEYTITYHLDGGILNNKITKYHAGEKVVLDTPEKPGFTFIGWYLNDDYKYICDQINCSDYGNKVFYAKWVANDQEYNVNFIDHRGEIIETKKVKYGEMVEKMDYDGESFIEYSWYLNNRIFDFNTPITLDIDLVAKWSILENILEDIIPNQASDNIVLPTIIDTSIGEISVVWSSSDITTISVRGNVNPLRVDTEVELQATLSLENQSYVHKGSVSVPAIIMRDLGNTKPVFAYLSSNMGGFKGLTGIPAQTIDVVNYCFARVTTSGTIHIGELLKLDEVLTVRRQGIRVVFSVGDSGVGPTGCENISKAASTAEGRQKLINSIITTIKTYHLDGIDIDWEYPGSWPASGVSSAEDKQNYTIFMSELRQALDELGEGYLLTAALPGGPGASARYNLPELSKSLDYLHLMSYDLHSGWRTCHHTALYNSENTPYGSVSSAVEEYSTAGFPKEKLVAGAAFYGRMFKLSSNPVNPMGATNILEGGISVTYTTISHDYLKRSTVKTGWDDDAKAPWLYDTASRTFISYDNPTSIKLKCQYVLNNDLGGIMFWDYGQDISGKLVESIYEELKQSK